MFQRDKIIDTQCVVLEVWSPSSLIIKLWLRRSVNSTGRRACSWNRRDPIQGLQCEGLNANTSNVKTLIQAFQYESPMLDHQEHRVSRSFSDPYSANFVTDTKRFLCAQIASNSNSIRTSSAEVRGHEEHLQAHAKIPASLLDGVGWI